MKIMVVGGGGREHAIIRKIKENPDVETIYALPGNGGIAADAVCIPVSATDIDGIVAFAAGHGIDYAVVAPDDPLVLGCVDALEAAGIPCFGPRANAAVIEGSKVFSKNLMKKYRIPTASYETFSDMDAALRYLETAPVPTVIKADGLALGKGVIIAQTREEAFRAVREMMADKKFGRSGETIVIEEFLTGPEVSVLSFTDGNTVVPMISSMDHKRSGDGDTGLNTGGMGTVAPNPFYTPEVAKRCMKEIFLPTINAMNEEGRTFRGCLYFGLMLTPDGPKVIEYNCRFGDPETQVVLPLLESDLLTVMQAVTNGTLAQTEVKFSDRHACCVIMASEGYPVSYEKGFEITIPEKVRDCVFVAGATLQEEKLLTGGGRVLGVTAVRDTLAEAIDGAYEMVRSIHFDNAFYRHDIGAKALAGERPGVFRVFAEKRPELAHEAHALFTEATSLLRIPSLTNVRIINRYDVENITEELFDYAKTTVFSEPQLDIVTDTLNAAPSDHTHVFAVEYLPGQFDQRADSAAQCIQIISQAQRPLIRTARVYVLEGDLTPEEVDRIKKYVINPVEAREASFELPDTLNIRYEIPTEVDTLNGFTSLDEASLEELLSGYGLAMDLDDLRFCQAYFRQEQRDPTITEIRVIDTYWSDHCRHTTFHTIIDHADFPDPQIRKTYEEYLQTRRELGVKKPICLMDIGTIAAKALKKQGKLDKLDESEEVNACTVKVTVTVDGKEEPWLLLFKNETHNHPTEIEPFGGAATCIGGAIRDPLSGRSYVYGAMRVTGAADPLTPIDQTIRGKLPQRKIVTTAAAGYSSYGNQIGLATGIVDELYHPGYAAKRMEIGAVIAAAPAENVRREAPSPGDVVILLGGATGRDGCGGATGSSKSHTVDSLETCGAEVQKGNAPEERKLQRLFRNPEASRMIKRCNDFGAGGVSVAIGELADGLTIDLNAVPKKYEGLDGTELAISESQERMAVVIEPQDVDAFLRLADQENLMATPVALVQENPRLVMHWNGRTIVDLSREFLDSNGAEKHIRIEAAPAVPAEKEITGSFTDNLFKIADDLNTCSKRGLAERFDSTIGAGTVLMPFGGKHQLTPAQAMVQKISVEEKHTQDCSLMSFGYNPFLSEKTPYHGAYLAVVESVCKLIACGAAFQDVYLTFQEYFERPGKDPKRWGKPFSALLGAFRAQMGLQVAAIGGKDSMSGTFEDLDVPPTLVSFAVTTAKTEDIISPEFKTPGNKVLLLTPEHDADRLPKTESLLAIFRIVTELIRSGICVSCYTPGMGGIGEAVMKMAFGNGLGMDFNTLLDVEDIFQYRYGSFLLEVTEDVDPDRVIGTVTDTGAITRGEERIELSQLLNVYEAKLESVFPCNIGDAGTKVADHSWQAARHEGKGPDNRAAAPHIRTARPRVLIPAFPGSNCEMDSAKAVRDAGADPQIIVINNLTADGISRSVERFAEELKASQMIFIPGGFSGGDEPDGSGKFITAFFRNAAIKEGITELLEKRDGLMCGICNGFQALIKLGLVPYGRIIDTDADCPTLTFNTIGRHQSRIVRTRIVSDRSPWLSLKKVGDIVSVPISHGEGRFLASEELIAQLAENGQIATQYVDLDGNASADIRFNPNGSMHAIEGITSPDGRVFGKMGHSERIGSGLYKNVPGDYDIRMFEAAVRYYQ